MPIEIAALKGWEECVKLLFPVTTPLLEYADWSTDGIIQHGKTVSVSVPHLALLYSFFLSTESQLD
jgi:hypothetical protein